MPTTSTILKRSPRTSHRWFLPASLIALLFSFLIIFPAPAYAIPSAEDIDLSGLEPPAGQILINTPEPEISIPFVTLSPAFVEPASGELIAPWIGEYAAGVYKFLLSIVGVLAGVFLLIGGFTYLTAGGSAERVSSAKNKIVNALTGLILAFGSYVILFTINPDLVTFEALRLKAIKTDKFDFGGEFSGSDWDGVLSEGTIEPGIPTGNVPLIKQGSFRLANGYVYLNSNQPPVCDQSSISSSGCGIVSAAMVTAFYQNSGKTGATNLVKPLKNLSTQNGHRTCNDTCGSCSGTKGSFYKDQSIWGAFGLKGKRLSGGRKSEELKQNIISSLQQGKPVVLHVKRGIFTEGGHFILATGINSNGNIMVNDPARRNTYTNVTPKSKIEIPGGPYKNDNIPPNLVFDVVANAYLIEPK